MYQGYKYKKNELLVDDDINENKKDVIDETIKHKIIDESIKHKIIDETVNKGKRIDG